MFSITILISSIQNYHVEYLATETAAEMSDWLQAIHQVAQKVSIDGLSLEHGRSKEFDKVEGKNIIYYFIVIL